MHEEPKGRFDRHDALPVGEIPAKLDYLDEAIGRLSADVDRVIAPFEPGLALLDAIPIDLAAKGLQGGGSAACPRSRPLPSFLPQARGGQSSTRARSVEQRANRQREHGRHKPRSGRAARKRARLD